jgi:oligopeptide transport system ATP-binding protein
MDELLSVVELETRFDTPEGEVAAVDGVSFSLDTGECLGVVGESGSGKTQVFLSIMGLLAKNGRCSGRVRFRGEDILGLPAARLNSLRGSRMAMIFQDPMTSLNPYLTVSRQLTEVLIEHLGLNRNQARDRALEALEQVGLPDPAARIDLYPHAFSGGMRQRVMIAMAVLCQPDLLIADEPTTALDVTIQAQILDLMRTLRRESNTSTVVITHDLGVVAGLCDRVLVMYAGRLVETGSVREIFYHPRHPYTQGLLRAMPRLDQVRSGLLATIPGQPPNLQALPPGCAYQARCPQVFPRCGSERPGQQMLGPRRSVACHLEQVR